MCSSLEAPAAHGNLGMEQSRQSTTSFARTEKPSRAKQRQPHTPGEEGMQDMRLIGAIYPAARSGEVIKRGR
jgi:hypothetical protein